MTAIDEPSTQHCECAQCGALCTCADCACENCDCPNCTHGEGGDASA